MSKMSGYYAGGFYINNVQVGAAEACGVGRGTTHGGRSTRAADSYVRPL